MIDKAGRFLVLCITATTFLVLTGGCEPKGSPPQIQVPPPGIERQTPPKTKQYSYDHKVRYGGANSQMKQALRKEYVVAVARVGDTGLVDTPFGDKQVISSVVGVVGGGQGPGENVEVAVGESLRAEPTPPGFTQTARSQLISFMQQTNCFTIVERESINDIVRELEFDNSKWVAKNPDTPKQGRLSGVRYIIKGSLERNLNANPNQPVTPDNWVGQTGFPEDNRENMPLIFRLRMYSVESGVIVAVGDGYGSTGTEAVNNAVRALTRLVIRDHKRNH